MTFTVHQIKNVRNRAYVYDDRGNRLFYGTLFQCGKFIEYMLEGSDSDARNQLDRSGKTKSKSVVSLRGR